MLGGCERHYRVKGLVQSGPGQVVHGCINDAKVFFLAWLDVEHLADAHTGIAHQRPARLDHEFFMAMAALVNFL